MTWQLSIKLLFALFLLSACNSQPTDIFLPVVIGEATAAPTILDTPASTPISTSTRLSVTPTNTSSPLTLTPRTPFTRTPSTGTPSTPAIIVQTPSDNPPNRTPIAQRGTPRSGVEVATATPTTLFRSYLALIVSQLQSRVSPAPTPTPTILAPIVVTPASPTSTPTPIPTNLPTATSGVPTRTPTPFAGTVRLLERDPVDVSGVIPIVAYADPDNVLEKDWSDFYGQHPTDSESVRIYASESSRIYGPALALMSSEQWAEGVCMIPSTLVGVQFWGDENDGWARVLVDGVERWRGNTYGQTPQLFVRYLEISGLPSAPHVVRIEPLGRLGTTLSGGNDHVSIYAIVCGLPIRSEIFVPILQR